MADTIEFEAPTEEEAVRAACEAVGIDPKELDYTVVDEGSDGVFGLGSRPVKIRVRPPAPDDEPDEAGTEASPALRGPAPEKAAQAGEVVRQIFEHMGLEAQVEVRDEDETIVVVVSEAEGSTRVAEILGSRRPPPIPALQFLLNKIVNRFPEDRKHVTLEVPGVPKRERRRSADAPKPASSPASVPADAPMPSAEEVRAEVDPELDPTLVDVGFELAERAKRLDKVISVFPMLPGDRRAVHQTIMRIPGAETLSDGEGLYRKMYVVPASLSRGGGSSGGKRRRRRRRGGGRGPSASA